MTSSELRLELLKLVWPMGTGRENADPGYFIAKAKELEEWCLDHVGTTEEPAPKRRGRPPKTTNVRPPLATPDLQSNNSGNH